MKERKCKVINILKFRKNKVKIVCKDMETGLKYRAISSSYNWNTLFNNFHVGDDVIVIYNEWFSKHGKKVKSIELNVGKMTLFWKLTGRNIPTSITVRDYIKSSKKLNK